MESYTDTSNKSELGPSVKFHSNLDISVQELKTFATCHKIILQSWCLHLTSTPVLNSAIKSQALWYSKHIKIDNKSLYLSEISGKGLVCTGHLYNECQKLKTQDDLKQEYSFYENKRVFMRIKDFY